MASVTSGSRASSTQSASPAQVSEGACLKLCSATDVTCQQDCIPNNATALALGDCIITCDDKSDPEYQKCVEWCASAVNHKTTTGPPKTTTTGKHPFETKGGGSAGVSVTGITSTTSRSAASEARNTSSPSTASEGSSRLSPGGKAGIAIGVIVFTAAVIGIFVFFCLRQRRNNNAGGPSRTHWPAPNTHDLSTDANAHELQPISSGRLRPPPPARSRSDLPDKELLMREENQKFMGVPVR